MRLTNVVAPEPGEKKCGAPELLNPITAQPFVKSVPIVLWFAEPKTLLVPKPTLCASQQKLSGYGPGSAGEKSVSVMTCGEASSRLNTTPKNGSHAPTLVTYFFVNGGSGASSPLT